MEWKSILGLIAFEVACGITFAQAPEKTCSAQCCSTSTCSSVSEHSERKSNDLVVLRKVKQLQHAFNEQQASTKFVAILSSTCIWCRQGAESINETIVKRMRDKDIGVIIVWTNMLSTDDKNSAQYSASLFEDNRIIQFFDRENKFGDLVAQTISEKGKKAWDIYLFYDGSSEWKDQLPSPIDYAHQLGDMYEWADRSKYFCGENLRNRLDEIVDAL